MHARNRRNASSSKKQQRVATKATDYSYIPTIYFHKRNQLFYDAYGTCSHCIRPDHGYSSRRRLGLPNNPTAQPFLQDIKGPRQRTLTLQSSDQNNKTTTKIHYDVDK
jgi:hypothetical protein